MVFGFGKKKDENIGNVKDAVSKRNESMDMHGVPQSVLNLEYREPALGPEDVKDSVPDELHMVEPLPDKARFAPLFVKVDRYREILESINKMKANIVNVQSMLSIEKQISDMKSQVDSELEKEVQELKLIVNALDKELVRPKAVEPYIMPKPSDVAKMETYVSDLQNELSKLQSQVKKIEQ